MFPYFSPTNMSWEGHLSGGIMGTLCAFVFVNHGPQRPEPFADEKDDDEEEVYRLVTSIRGNSLKGLISIESPLGKAVRGHKEGDSVYVRLGENTGYSVVIKKIEKTGEDDTDRIRSY